MDHYHHHHDDQYHHQMGINNNPYNTIITTQPPRTTIVDSSTTATTMMMDDDKKMMTTSTTRPQEPRNCPRCNSSNTKFCYYNNYSLAQPRYLCKSCRRYWTEGGSLRNVPVGGGSRKNKKLPLLLPNSSTSSTSTKNLPDLNPPFVFTSSSSNPSKNHDNNNDLSLSFSNSPMQDKRDQEHYGHFTDQAMTGGQNCLFQAPPMGMIQFRQEYNHDQNKKTSLGFSLDRNKEEIGSHDYFVVNGGGSNKMMFPYGGHDHHHDQRHDDGNKKREGGSSNELWSGIILGGDSGGPTW